ncbi:MAG: NAD(P)-binding protein [Deltaproteobacteria bacterium]|nr:NAD(P)-binding protein [Deltaproteobacteria bacterium]
MSLGYRCARAGMKTVILEREDRPGGAFHSHTHDGSGEGFWLELGAHTCYNSYGNLLSMIEGCGIQDQLQPRAKVPFKMIREDRLKSIPSCINFSELLLSVPRLFRLRKEGQSVASYYGPIVGRKNFKTLFSHLFNSVLSQETGDFPADMLFKKRSRRKDVLKSFTFRRGLQSLAGAATSQKGLEVRFGEGVSVLRKEGRDFRVLLREGREVRSPSVALAVPASTAASLLDETLPDLAGELHCIKTVRIESLGVVVEKKDLSLPPFAGAVAAEDSFYSIVSRDTVPHHRYRGFTFHFKPGRLDREGKVRRACELLGLTENQLVDVVEKENLLPALRVGHKEWVRRIDEKLRETSLYLTGNYFSGVAIEDCVSRSFSEFDRLKQDRS